MNYARCTNGFLDQRTELIGYSRTLVVSPSMAVRCELPPTLYFKVERVLLCTMRLETLKLDITHRFMTLT